MRTTTLAIIIGLLSMAAGSDPDTLWVRRLDFGGDEYGYGVACGRGTVVAVGSHISPPSPDVMVVKLNGEGDTIWTRMFDAGAAEWAIDACIDAEANVLLAGYSVVFDGMCLTGRPGPSGRSTRPSVENPVHALTAKLDSVGELKWLKTDSNHQALGIAADASGNCYVAGASGADTVSDFWLAKRSPDGDSIWTRTFDFATSDAGYRLAMDDSGNVVAAGRTGAQRLFDCVTVKFTPGGDTIWTRRFDLGPDDEGCGVAVDRSGNVIVAGISRTDTTSDILVLKYDRDGVLLWSRVFDFDVDDLATGTDCDSTGNIYVSGYTGASMVYDGLVMKLDPAGDTLWTTTYGGLADEEVCDVACDSAGNPVVAGFADDSHSGRVNLLVAKYSSFLGVAQSPPRGPVPGDHQIPTFADPDLVLSVPCSGHYDIGLCDLTGRLTQWIFRGYLTSGAHRLPLAGEPTGMYIVTVAAPDGGVSCQRLLLVR
jgi:hypothetical protein